MFVARVLMAMSIYNCLVLKARQPRYSCVKLEIPGTNLRKEKLINLQLIQSTLARYVLRNVGSRGNESAPKIFYFATGDILLLLRFPYCMQIHLQNIMAVGTVAQLVEH